MPNRTHTSRSRRLASGVLAATVLVPAGVAIAKAGDADPAFGTAGRATLALDARPSAVIAQPDGKLVLADEERFRLTRVNADGTLDRTFDGDGSVSLDFGSGVGVLGAVRQSNGAIVAVGSAGDTPIVVRVGADGALDPSFDPGDADGPGKQVGGFSHSANAVALQEDGSILVAGSSNRGLSVTRLLPDGTPDGTEYDETKEQMVPTHAAVSLDGELVLAGEAQTKPPNFDVVLARYSEKGKLDATLGGDGVVHLGPPDRSDVPAGLAVQRDGKAVVVATTGPSDPRITVMRIGRDGAPDASFGTGGETSPEFVGEDIAAGVAVAPDGKVVVMGTADLTFAAARFDAAGRLDPTFGTDGRALLPFQGISAASAGALLPDGGIALAGQTVVEPTKVRTAVARLLGDQPVTPTPTPTPSPSPTPTPTPTATPDTRAPELSGLRVVRPKAGRKAKVRFAISEAGTVALAVKRRGGGTVRASRPVAAGAVTLRFGRRLEAGKHRLVVVPTDAAGNAGVARRVRFRVR